MTDKQINQLSNELDRLLPWTVAYGHLNFGDLVALGKMAVRDLRKANDWQADQKNGSKRQVLSGEEMHAESLE